MSVFILIDVQYSQKAVFSFGKGLNRQNHSSSGSFHLVKKFPPVKFPIPPNHLPLFGKSKYIKLMPRFCGWVQLPQGYTEPL